MFSRQLIITNPERIDEIKAEAKATLEMCRHCEQLMRLRKFGDWERFDWAYMCTWANSIDEPFVKLMLSLSRNGYTYGAISMHRWWRRLKAVNQQNLISFFTYKDFNHDKRVPLYWEELYQKCCRTQDMFSKMSNIYISDTSVEMNLRALLGISQNRDIKEAWTQWAKTNHPDKGGSVEKFVLVKAAYEEWQNATSQR